MTKNIIIYSDGTGQVGGKRPDQLLSNIYKMYRATRVSPFSQIDPSKQVAFYDAGLGTDDGGGSIFKPVKFIRKLMGSISGQGITTNIIECYEAILNYYEPGDRIFLFGFSRGAYTARCVANVVTLLGVPSHNKDGLPIQKFSSETKAIAAEAVRKVYEHGAGHPRAKYEDERNEKARRFREVYGSEADGVSNVSPYFVGVFDTVAALGAKGPLRVILTLVFLMMVSIAILISSYLLNRFVGWDWWPSVSFNALIFATLTILGYLRASLKTISNFPKKGRSNWHLSRWKAENYDRGLSGQVMFGRHAISIDESRADFPPVGWGFKNVDYNRGEGVPFGLKQVWFPGNHSDIGGSYPENESRLSDISLQWMLEEAMDVPEPLIVDGKLLNVFPDAKGVQHSQIRSILDSYPKWVPESLRYSWKEKVRKPRGLTHHPSVAERMAASKVVQSGLSKPYRPFDLMQDKRYLEHYKPMTDKIKTDLRGLHRKLGVSQIVLEKLQDSPERARRMLKSASIWRWILMGIGTLAGCGMITIGLQDGLEVIKPRDIVYICFGALVTVFSIRAFLLKRKSYKQLKSFAIEHCLI